MSDNAANDKALNAMILGGKALEGFDLYYADDVSMQENANPPMVGKAANREREIAFFGSIEKANRFELGKSAVEGDTSFSEWFMDVELKNGFRMVSNQVSRRTWRDGKIIDERFFYNAG